MANWLPWWPRSAPPAPPEGALILRRLPGRLRRYRHLALLVPACAGAWGWFGAAGVLPALLWWWHRWPDGAGVWRLNPADVQWLRLGRYRTCIRLAGGARLEIFHDEIEPDDLARLRRTLKFRLSAGRGLEHVEPV